jgi:hypothetical protein
VTGFGLAALVGALFTARTNPGLLLAADGTVAVPGWGFPVVVATSLLGVGWAFLVALTERASDAANGSDGRGRAVRWAVTAAATVVITAVLPVWPFFVDDPHRSAALLLGLVALAAALAPTRSTRWSAGFDLLLFATSGFAALISVGGSLDYANLSLVPEFDLWNMGPIIVLLAGGIGAAIGLAQFVRRLHAATKTAALSAAPTEPTGLGG